MKRATRRNALTALLRVGLGCAVSVAILSACGSSTPPAEYPKVKVQAAVLELVIIDQRQTVMTRIEEPSRLYRDEAQTFGQQLPATFEPEAIERLGRITGSKGLNLKVVTQVERADVTFVNDPRGNYARYDVTLGFRIITEKGTSLKRGRGSAWRELPENEATPNELERALTATSLEAFDRYFASEATVQQLNANINAYRKAHPNSQVAVEPGLRE